MLRLTFFGILLAYSLNAVGQKVNYHLRTSAVIAPRALRTGFKVPPDENKLRCYWWWLNSMVTKESITRDLEQMKAKGYGGASLIDAGGANYLVAHKTPAGPVFMSPDWMALYQHAIKEAQRLGLELSVNVQSGWNPGGPMITPELALKKLVYSEISLSGGKNSTIRLPQRDSLLMYRS